MSNRELIQDAQRLSVLHPDAKISIMVTSAEVTDCKYSLQGIIAVELDLWYSTEENVFIGEHAIIEAIEERIDANDYSVPSMSDEEISQQAKAEYEALIKSKAITERIIIYTGQDEDCD